MSIPRKLNSHMPPMHPGEILREEFMVPFGLIANAVAIALRVPAPRILEIVREVQPRETTEQRTRETA